VFPSKKKKKCVFIEVYKVQTIRHKEFSAGHKTDTDNATSNWRRSKVTDSP